MLEFGKCSLALAMTGNIRILQGAKCSSVVRAFAHGAMGRRIDPSWGGPIQLFLVSANAPQLVTKSMVCAILSVGWYI